LKSQVAGEDERDRSAYDPDPFGAESIAAECGSSSARVADARPGTRRARNEVRKLSGSDRLDRSEASTGA
jgi:hypothetical protein